MVRGGSVEGLRRDRRGMGGASTNCEVDSMIEGESRKVETSAVLARHPAGFSLRRLACGAPPRTCHPSETLTMNAAWMSRSSKVSDDADTENSAAFMYALWKPLASSTNCETRRITRSPGGVVDRSFLEEPRGRDLEVPDDERFDTRLPGMGSGPSSIGTGVR